MKTKERKMFLIESKRSVSSEYSDLISLLIKEQEQFGNIIVESMNKQHLAILLEEGFFDTVLSTLKRIWGWIVKSINDFLEWLASFFLSKGLGGESALMARACSFLLFFLEGFSPLGGTGSAERT